MKEMFRFWGYCKNTFDQVTGVDRNIVEVYSDQEELTPILGEIYFSDLAKELAGSIAEMFQDSIYGYVLIPKNEEKNKIIQGELLAWIEPKGQKNKIPLVIKSNNTYYFYFNVDQTIQFVQQEKYFLTHPPIYVKLGISPENLPALLRKLIVKSFSVSRALQGLFNPQKSFPASGQDFSVDIWHFLVKGIMNELGYENVPLWPEGKSYAVVLNHDVDTEWGFKNKEGIEWFRDIEEKLNLRSAWMVVTKLQGVGQKHLQDLLEGGHEIGCHSTVHDHSIAYLPDNEIYQRLESAKDFFHDFECVGFRSPSYHRSEALYRGLDHFLEYDMSMHDTFENLNSPAASFEGCSTCFPFTVEGTNLLQIPTSVPEDLVLEMMGQTPEQAIKTQIKKIYSIRKREGVANILTHPEPQLSARPAWRKCYESVLKEISDDQKAWFVLPKDLTAWWKKRQVTIDKTWELVTS